MNQDYSDRLRRQSLALLRTVGNDMLWVDIRLALMEMRLFGKAGLQPRPAARRPRAMGGRGRR